LVGSGPANRAVRSTGRHDMQIKLLIALTLFTVSADLVMAQLEEPLKQHSACDFVGFMESVKQVQAVRKDRLLSARQFAVFSQERNTLVLDARGQADFVLLHVKGSKNLPYTTFGLESLRELIPDTETRILIYCRNNLANSAVKNLKPFIEKSPEGGLNIPTAITLYSYGYKNVWELDEIVDPDNCPIEFVRKPSED
jgi:Rhodanese-like domain